jgi:hypothetical protein
VKNIAFWVDFVAENSNKSQKLGSEGKSSWALNDVFTLGPMAQSTLVFIIISLKRTIVSQTRCSYLFICILTTSILMLSFLKGEKYVLSHKYSPNNTRTKNLLCGHFLWQFCYARTFFRQVCCGIWNSSMRNPLDR